MVQKKVDINQTTKLQDRIQELQNKLKEKNNKTKQLLKEKNNKINQLIGDMIEANDEAQDAKQELKDTNELSEYYVTENDLLKKEIQKLKEEAENYNMTTLEHDGAMIEYNPEFETANPQPKTVENPTLKKLRENSKTIDQKMNQTVIGQTEAISTLKKALISHFSGLSEEKPSAFLVYGPTGTGKTYTAKILNEILFDGLEEKPELLQISAPDYYDEHKINILIGSAPGYVGYEDGGLLPSFIKKTNGKGIILIDEIEKGHQALHKFLLTIMDEGKITIMEPGQKKGPGMPTENGGMKVYDCTEYIIILTSNIGEKEAATAKNLGFATTQENLEEKRQSMREEAITTIFPPEFLNRLKAKIKFNRLGKEDIQKICDIELQKISKRATESYIANIKVTQAAKEQLLKEGFSPKYGARQLKRILEERITSNDKLIDILEQGDNATVDFTGEQFVYKPE